MGLRFTFFKQKIFSSIRKKVLGPFAKGVIYQTENGLLSAPIDDVAVGKSLGFKGRYDSGEIAMLGEMLTSNDVLFVIGTHIGALLIPLGKKCKEVVGYEANPDTFEYLKTNVELNGLRNTRLFNLAVGDSNRQVEFYQNRSNSGGSKIKPKIDHYMYNYDSPATIKVDMIDLDGHTRSQGLPRANGFIMDIEGAEYFALKGMQESLKTARFLYIEYIPHCLQNVSCVTNAEFFQLIVPHFEQVRFARNTHAEIDLKKDRETFATTMDEFMRNGTSDDLLFSK